MNDKVKTPVTDKNGKHTHVHKNVSAAPKASDRVSVVPVATPAVDEWVPPERKTLAEMREWAKSLHPNARLSLNNGKWTVEIETDYEEDETLPERFNGTPAGEAAANFNSSYGSELGDWAHHSGERDQPIEIVAELYNRATESHQLAREWFDLKASEQGLRSYNEIIHAPSETVTDAEKELITKWGAGRDHARSPELRAFIEERQKESTARLVELGYWDDPYNF